MLFKGQLYKLWLPPGQFGFLPPGTSRRSYHLNWVTASEHQEEARMVTQRGQGGAWLQPTRDLRALPLPAVTIKGSMQQAQPKTGTVTRILGLLRRKVSVGDGTSRPLRPAEVEAEDDGNLEWTAKEGDTKAEFGHSPPSGRGAHGAEEKLRCKWGPNVAPTLHWDSTEVTELGHPLGFRREYSGQTSSKCQTLAGSPGRRARQVCEGPAPSHGRDGLARALHPIGWGLQALPPFTSAHLLSQVCIVPQPPTSSWLGDPGSPKHTSLPLTSPRKVSSSISWVTIVPPTSRQLLA